MGATPLTPDLRATRRAAAQHGLLNHAQAIAAGLTDRQIEYRVLTGRWVRIATGLYRVAGAPDTWRQRAQAAVLATTRAGGVASHLTAAALHGLLPASPLPHVTVPPGRGDRTRVARIHRSPLPAADRCTVDGIAATTVSRTMVDLGALLERPRLENVIDDALCRGFATRESILTVADRFGGGRRGVGLVRAVLEVWSPAIHPESPAEARLLRLLADLGVDDVVTQYEVHDENGLFVARLDAASPSRRKGFEYDSRLFHGPRRWAHDEPRYANLARLGWEVAGLTKLDLMPGESRLRDLVAAWLAA